MSQSQIEQQLLAAVLNDPDNDAPRLQYAQWLMEQENPRGKFIQIQCELAGLPEQPNSRILELESLERELLDQYRQKWAAPLCWIPASFTYGDQQYAVRSYQFHRGFIDTITINIDDLIHSGERIFSLAPIRHLQLTNTSLSSLRPSPYFDQISSLNIRAEQFKDSDLAKLVGLSQFQQLHTLDISGNEITANGLAALLSSTAMPQLTRLSINNNPIGDDGIKLLSQSPRLSALKRLELSRAKLTSTAMEYLAASPYVANLAELILSGNTIGNEGLQALTQSTTLKSLKSLIVIDTEIGAQGIAALTKQSTPFCLTELNAGKNDLSLTSAELLANSENVRELELLFLPACSIGTKGTQAIAASPYLQKLRRLDLNENYIGNQGVIALASSPLLAQLYQLRLAKNGINDQGAMALVKSSSQVNINPYSTIDLSGNPLGIAAIRAMLLSNIRPLQIAAKYQTPVVEPGSNFLKPKRKQLQPAREIAVGYSDVQQLWHKFAEKELIPNHWLTSSKRVFEKQYKIECPDCGGSGMSGYQDPCYSCYSGLIDSYEIVTEPPTIEMVILLAADPGGVERAENLVIKIIQHLSNWGFQPVGPGYLIRWRLTDQLNTFQWRTIRLQPFEPIITALKQLNHDPLIKNLTSVENGWLEIASLSWELAAKANMEPYHSQYKNPFQLLMELQKTGYTLAEMTPESILLIMPVQQ